MQPTSLAVTASAEATIALGLPGQGIRVILVCPRATRCVFSPTSSHSSALWDTNPGYQHTEAPVCQGWASAFLPNKLHSALPTESGAPIEDGRMVLAIQDKGVTSSYQLPSHQP